MASQKETLLTWLRDAHGLEGDLIEKLEAQTEDEDILKYPELQARLREHLVATRRHKTMVEGCIERLGGETSMVKEGLGRLLGSAKAALASVARDSVVKYALLDYTAEAFEIASYTSLVAAAQEYGDAEALRVCEEILLEERAMLEYLEEQIPLLTVEVIRLGGEA